MKCLVTYYPNPACVRVAVKKQVCNYFFSSQSKGRSFGDDPDEREKIGELAVSLGNAMLAIDGVTDVSLRPYEVSLTVAPTWTREEVVTMALAAMEHFCEEVLEVSEEYMKPYDASGDYDYANV